MKKIAFVLLTLVLFACSTQEDGPTLLTFSIENAIFENAEVVVFKDFIAYNRDNLTSTADENGVFTFELDLQNPITVFATLGQQRFPLFLNRGGELHISADMNNWDESLTFEGTYAAENRFLVIKNREFQPNYGQNVLFARYQELDAAAFTEFINQMQAEATSLLNGFNEKRQLSRDFVNYFNTDVRYTGYTHLLNYPSYSAYFRGTLPDVPDNFYDFLPGALKFSDYMFHTRSFVGFLSSHLQYYMQKNLDQMPLDKDEIEKAIWAANRVYSGKALQYVMASLIHEYINWGEFSKAEAAFFEFRDSSKDPQLTAILTQTYESALRISPGKQAPSFTLTNIYGEEVSLSDFKGKVVYLDFWASWCGPCMREVPYAKELKKRFDGIDDLVFLYISVDEDEQAWRDKVEEQDIRGVHLNIKGMSHEIAELYNVRGVPTFFIIDRNGVIFENRPGRPSSGDLIDSQLRAALDSQISS